MLALSAPTDKAIRAQVAESVALIAELDFPNKWDNLIDVRYYHFFQNVNQSRYHIATSVILLSERLQYQPRCSSNGTFNLPAVEGSRPI
jgi:exportin-2 (importin alpha re-exporter)